jgi:DNA-binding XRE family transcriptional regulator
VALTFTGPAAKAKEALDAMRALGFTESEGAKPWRDVLDFSEAELPGVFLSGARYREGLTQVELSERTGIPRRHISEMENGKRPIGKHTARKLAEVLNIDARRLLSL